MWRPRAIPISGLDALDAPVVEAAVAPLFATYGFREGELARLTLEDLDLEHEVVRIWRVWRHDVQT